MRILKNLFVVTLGAALWLSAALVGAQPPQSSEFQFSWADFPNIARQLPLGGLMKLFGIDIEGGLPADLELERFEVFAPDAEILLDDDQSIPPPDHAYYRGKIAGQPDSRVFLTVPSQGEIRGLIQSAAGIWLLGGDKGQIGRGLRSKKVDVATELAVRPFECGTEHLPIPPAELVPAISASKTPDIAALAANVQYTARLAIETDAEFLGLFGNNTSAALDYIGDLIAYASTLYEREVNTNLIVSYSRLWTTGVSNDPWAANSTSAGLSELKSYWTNNMGGTSRTTVHMLSGKNLGGGIAYVGALCDNTYGYGFSSSLGGDFNIDNPSVVWDLLEVSHELGHNFNSPHTHCYKNIGGNSNPVDACYSGESGTSCFSGTTSLPGTNSLTGGSAGGGNGTVMSYCHLLNGGYGNISYTFGLNHSYGIAANRVPSRMASYVASRASSYPSCLSLQGQSYSLTVAKAGTGSGTVSGTGISCDPDCTETYAQGTQVTLTAAAASGSTFAGWSGGGCSGTGNCVVTMNANQSVTATFNSSAPVTYSLTVAKAGTGSGTISGTGISCDPDCTETYAQGTQVTLTAAAASGSTFAGWSGGGCSGTGNCVVTMNSNQSITATFNTSIGSSPLAEALDTTGLAWTTGGNAPWTKQTTTTHDGVDAARSGTITHNQQSWMETQVTGPGTLKFWWQVSSQLNGDSLRFTIDGVAQSQINGTVNWVQRSYSIAAGTHTLRWTYAKNSSITSGSDAGWVDQVEFSGGTPNYTLTVTKAGTGSGTVSGTGISCDPDCTESYAQGTQVTLTASATSGSTFAGWSGGGCSGTGNCVVTMNANQSVTATFNSSAPVTYSLTVAKAGTGSGTISGTGISCDPDCTETYAQGTQVTLTAAAASGSTFAGWSGGGCSGTGNCVVTMNANQSVTATFNTNSQTTYSLTVAKAGTGSGTVSGTGISCDPDCTETYAQGTQVTLTVAAASGSTFAGWSGGGCSGTGNCVVTMNANQSVTATFNSSAPVTYSLTVTKAGTGSGTVSGTGISCDPDCTETYAQGTQVTLTAAAASGSTFAGWSGGGCSGTGNCVVTMNSNQSITATFNTSIGSSPLAEALDTTGLAWTTGGNAPWTKQTTTTHDGVDAARSGTITHNQQSWMETQVTGPGTLKFWWQVSSQLDGDSLRFTIDGVAQSQINGTVNWVQRSYSIAAGTHTLRWTYAKNSSITSGSDAGWVDQLQFP